MSSNEYKSAIFYTQTANAIVIDFTIGHNQLYIRQNGNTIWTYFYLYSLAYTHSFPWTRTSHKSSDSK